MGVFINEPTNALVFITNRKIVSEKNLKISKGVDRVEYQTEKVVVASEFNTG